MRGLWRGKSGCTVVVLLAVVLSFAACRAGDDAEEAHARPDLYLLVVDTLRADHVGLYGYERDTTPALDEFARHSLAFDDVVASAPWTLPSVATVLTGQYPSVHGVRAKRAERASVRTLRPKVRTLAEALRAAGYYTAAVITNEWLTAEHGLRRGFDEYHVLRRPEARFANQITEPATVVHRMARAILEVKRARPVFLYLHYMDVHGPYPYVDGASRDALGPVRGAARLLSSEEYENLKYLRLPGVRTLGGYVDAYDHGVRAWDDAFGRFTGWLKTTGRLDGSVISVVADHGEEFLDHGGWEHGETLHREQLRVPWILRVPGVGGGRVRSVAGLIDVAPTLLAAVGITVPLSMAGRDARQADGAVPRLLFAELNACKGRWGTCEQYAVRNGARKLIIDRDRKLLYDLGKDPGEQRPLPVSEAAGLEHEIERWRQHSAAVGQALGAAGSADLGTDVRERLRSLGYLD